MEPGQARRLPPGGESQERELGPALPPEAQDAILNTIEQKQPSFFGMVLDHVRQGMFGDPSYGGNANFAGWDLLGYPGPRMAVPAELQQLGTKVKPVRASLRRKA